MAVQDFDSMDHERFMSEALDEAASARDAGDHPIGAVVVCDGVVVGRGQNRIRSQRSQWEHAEIRALRETDGNLLFTRHEDCIVYSTVEPCVMCLGTIAMLDIRHVVFGAFDPLRGGTDMWNNVPYVRKEVPRYVGGVLEQQCRELAASLLT